jgi:hypothetical protein
MPRSGGDPRAPVPVPRFPTAPLALGERSPTAPEARGPAAAASVLTVS